MVDAGITVRTFRTADARTAELGTISMLNSIARWHHEGNEAAQVADDLVEMAVRIVQGDNLDHQPPTGRHVHLECAFRRFVAYEMHTIWNAGVVGRIHMERRHH
ncbi:hypothetical protein [Rhodococcus rhodochrous]|uniref:hypothetical protein n=1 Tax=Rhodococcus rhodochrous TaxID=1829 RepID=UPI000E76E076